MALLISGTAMGEQLSDACSVLTFGFCRDWRAFRYRDSAAELPTVRDHRWDVPDAAASCVVRSLYLA